MTYTAHEAYYNVKDWGAIGDGSTDDASAINAAAVAADAAGGGILWFPAGTFLIGSNVSVKRTVHVAGAGVRAATVKATTDKQLIVEGGYGSHWKHTISGLTFDKVQVRYGNANTDYGNGCSVIHCEILGCSTAVYYGYNCWLTAIIDCSIHDCATGVHFAFSGKTDSGASMVIQDSAIFGCGTGVYVDGSTADGHDIKLIGSDIEHTTSYGIRYEPNADGAMFLQNVHMELCEGTYIQQVGGNLFIDGFWAFPNGTTHDRVFAVGGDGRCWLSNARLQWETSKLVRLSNTNARLIVDSDTVHSANAFFGSGSAAMNAGSTAGQILNGGMGIGGRYGKQFTGQQNVSVGTLSPGGGAATVATLQAYDHAPRVIEFDVQVSSVIGATVNTLRVLLNPGGVVSVDTVFPVAVGGGHVRVTYTPNGAFNASALYNGTWTNAQATDSVGHATQRFIDMVSLTGGGTGTSIVVRNLYEYVL